MNGVREGVRCCNLAQLLWAALQLPTASTVAAVLPAGLQQPEMLCGSGVQVLPPTTARTCLTGTLKRVHTRCYKLRLLLQGLLTPCFICLSV